MRLLGGMLSVVILCSYLAGSGRAQAQDPKAILDKGIQALGGQAKLAKAGAMTWKAKGKITFNGNENDVKRTEAVQGLDHYRTEMEFGSDGNPARSVAVVNGDKAWRLFRDNGRELDGDMLANEKRNLYLLVIPATLVPLKKEGFKLESAGEEKVGDKPAVGLKVTAPDGKDFKLYFDKESGLPVKLTARVLGFRGDEYQQETTYRDYKDFDGIKKATKIETKRDGETFLTQEITDFKVVEKLPADTFAEPK